MLAYMSVNVFACVQVSMCLHVDGMDLLVASGDIFKGSLDPTAAPCSTLSMKKGREAMRRAKHTVQLFMVALRP